MQSSLSACSYGRPFKSLTAEAGSDIVVEASLRYTIVLVLESWGTAGFFDGVPRSGDCLCVCLRIY